MSKAQLETYRNPTNKVRRVSNEEKVLNFLKENDKVYTGRKLASAMGINYYTIQPRISDLITKGYILEVGIDKGKTRIETKIKLNASPGLYSHPRKTKYQMLKEAVKRMVDPEIVKVVNEEYVRLIRKNKFNPLEKLDRNLEMLRMWEGGHKYCVIAKKYNISEARVSKIVKSYRIKKSKNQL